MPRPLLLIEASSGALTAVLISAGRNSVERLSVEGPPARLGAGLKQFAEKFQRARPIIIGLVSRRLVLVDELRLPTRDPDEARSIALLQFARSTPHSREELVVDVDFVGDAPGHAGRFACVIATKTSLAPLREALSLAGVRADRVTIDDFRQKVDASSDKSCRSWERKDWLVFAKAFDRGDVAFDLRGELERNEDDQRKIRSELVRALLIVGAAGMLFLAAVGIQLGQKMDRLAQVERAWKKLAPEVETLSTRKARLTAFRDRLERRTLFADVAEAVVSSIPDAVRLKELTINRDDEVRIQGVSPGIEAVNAFREALLTNDICGKLEIEALDKRPSEKGEEAVFAFSCRKGKG